MGFWYWHLFREGVWLRLKLLIDSLFCPPPFSCWSQEPLQRLRCVGARRHTVIVRRIWNIIENKPLFCQAYLTVDFHSRQRWVLSLFCWIWCLHTCHGRWIAPMNLHLVNVCKIWKMRIFKEVFSYLGARTDAQKLPAYLWNSLQ